MSRKSSRKKEQTTIDGDRRTRDRHNSEANSGARLANYYEKFMKKITSSLARAEASQ